MTQTPPIWSEQVSDEEVRAMAEALFDYEPRNSNKRYAEASLDVQMRFLDKAAWALKQSRAALNAAASIPASRGAETVREEPEERFKDLIGHYESVAELAIGMRMSARHFREKEPSDAVPQPRVMADFHDRVAVALERSCLSPHLEHGEAVGEVYVTVDKTGCIHSSKDIGFISGVARDTVARAEAADKRIATLEAALNRLATFEAFTTDGWGVHHPELTARVSYARQALSTHSKGQ